MNISLYSALGLDEKDRISIRYFSKRINISLKKLDYFHENHIIPDEDTLKTIDEHLNLSKYQIMIKMGIYDTELKQLLSSNSDFLNTIIKKKLPPQDLKNVNPLTVEFETSLGTLYRGDCLDLLNNTESGTFDLIFADPPFNLKKLYLSGINDNLSFINYVKWTEKWLDECIRTLKTGGSLFLWNIPKWNTYFSNFLNERLFFRHWIAVDIKYSLPISSRLYPSHYSLLYYVKGDKANSFHPDRLPMQVCKKCFKEIKDYGGYKNKMNPKGINLTDIWLDIPPVRHKKYKGREEANELSIKLLDRVIEIASEPNDVVFDPFGGSGSSYITAEMKKRRWVGVELGPVQQIVERFNRIDEENSFLKSYRKDYNQLFPKIVKEKRKQLNIWTDESFNTEIN